MKVLVTGGDGLLGSHLVRQLIERSFEVRVLVQPGSDAPTLAGLPIERIAADLTDDGPGLEEATRGCDGVFHCAAITSPFASSDLTWRVNLEGTRRVLDTCARQKVRRLVFVGSASSFQFGPLERPGDETGGFPAAYRGVPYMESKHQAMQLVQERAREGLDAVIVAPTFMLGSHDWRPSSGELVRQYVQRGFPLVPPAGRSFAYAADVAAATIAAFERGRTGEVYILGGANLTYRDFFGRVAKLAGVAPPRGILPESALRGAGAVGSLVSGITGSAQGFDRTMARLALCGAYYSSAKAIRELGMAQTPVEVGIRDCLAGLREHGQLPADARSPFLDRVALVTGASRGVGFATAAELIRRGAKVVITARGTERLTRAHQELVAMGGEVEAITGDVGNWEDAQRMVNAARDRWGRLDILVSNAGVSMRGQFADLSPEVCAQTINTNLLGSVYPTRAAMDLLIQSRGHVVLISSIAGLMGLPGASTYCASKGALTGLCESLRLELIPKGVHCGIVYLGYTEHDPEKRILAADGSLVLPGRPAHHTQAYAAGLIIKLIEQRRKQLIMTPIGGVGYLAHRFAPRFVEWAILKAQASQWKVFQQFS
ncbi:MAG: SDR family NAD(P)-dependent oxidoreductase [bacterium]